MYNIYKMITDLDCFKSSVNEDANHPKNQELVLVHNPDHRDLISVHNPDHRESIPVNFYHDHSFHHQRYQTYYDYENYNHRPQETNYDNSNKSVMSRVAVSLVGAIAGDILSKLIEGAVH